MSYSELFLLAVGLAMDAFAVSITNGLCSSRLRSGHILLNGMCFGGFQGLMPAIGYFLGKTFSTYITSLDHYVALVLLGWIGAKMVFDACTHKEEAADSYNLSIGLLLTQGIATSIDALAVGVSLAALPDVSIGAASFSIACITFVLSVAGCCFGRRFGKGLGSRALFLGGLILIGIGVKIFVEHMFF